MGAQPSTLAKCFNALVASEDARLTEWKPLLAQLPPRLRPSLQASAPRASCFTAANQTEVHPDIFAAGRGYFISLTTDFWARKLTAQLVRAGVPLPRKILQHQHSSQYIRAMESVVNIISSANLNDLQDMIALGFPVEAPIDLKAAEAVAVAVGAAQADDPSRARALIQDAEAQFPLPPLLAALQQSRSPGLGRCMQLLQAGSPDILLSWVPVTGRPLPSSLLQLPPHAMAGQHALSTYKRWAVLNAATPLFGITVFHVMFHNSFQPQHLFDAAALLQRADGSTGDMSWAHTAPQEPAMPSFPAHSTTLAAERRAFEQELCKRFFDAAANPQSVPSGVQLKPGQLPPEQVPLINALDAFGSSALSHAVDWALDELRRAAETAVRAWSSDTAAAVAGCTKHDKNTHCAQCCVAAAITGAMWVAWKHHCEAVFAVLLSLGADATRPQCLEINRRRDVSSVPMPLMDMLLMQWGLPSVQHLPSKYTRLQLLPVDFAGSVTSRNVLVATEWRNRQRAAAHAAGGDFVERQHNTQAFLPPDLQGGSGQHEVAGDNGHLLADEHSHLLQWLVGASDGVSGELSVVQYRQLLGGGLHRAPATVFQALKNLNERMQRHQADKEQAAHPARLARTACPASMDDLQLLLPDGEALRNMQPQVAFLLQRLLDMGAVPSVVTGRMLYFYAEVLPRNLRGALWYRRRQVVLSRAQRRAARRKAAANGFVD